MNKLKTLFTLCIIFFLSVSAKIISTEKYDVEILQNGVPVEISNNIVLLEKKEFVIRITLKNHEGVFMSASLKKDYYGLKPNEKIKDYKYLATKTRAEPNFNEEKELILDEESVSFLFYDTTLNWHRFDKEILVNGDTVTGTKTINQILMPNQAVSTPIQNFKNEIYLFFVATDDHTGNNEPREYGRAKIHIKWK